MHQNTHAKQCQSSEASFTGRNANKKNTAWSQANMFPWMSKEVSTKLVIKWVNFSPPYTPFITIGKTYHWCQPSIHPLPSNGTSIAGEPSIPPQQPSWRGFWPPTPPEIVVFNKALLKGNQWIISPDHKAAYFWGRYVSRGRLTSNDISGVWLNTGYFLSQGSFCDVRLLEVIGYNLPSTIPLPFNASHVPTTTNFINAERQFGIHKAQPVRDTETLHHLDKKATQSGCTITKTKRILTPPKHQEI